MPPVTGSPSAAAGRRHQRLAQDLAGHGVGGTGGDAEQRHRAQELAAIALALGQLLPGQIDERMDPPLLPILLAHAIAPSSSMRLAAARTGASCVPASGDSPIAACRRATLVSTATSRHLRASARAVRPGLLNRNDRSPAAGCQNRIAARADGDAPVALAPGPVCAASADRGLWPAPGRRRALLCCPRTGQHRRRWAGQSCTEQRGAAPPWSCTSP